MFTHIVKRDGRVELFDEIKITKAIKNAFTACDYDSEYSASRLTTAVVEKAEEKYDLNRAAELKYGRLPALTAEIEEAEKLAQSILDQRAGDYLTGKGKCEGNAKVACGNKIMIKDVGKELDGEYYVTTSKHSLKLGQGRGCGYWTEFTVSRTGH